MPAPNTGFTRRFNSVHAARPHRAHCALQEPIELSQRSHSAVQTPSCGVYFEHAQNKRRRIAF